MLAKYLNMMNATLSGNISLVDFSNNYPYEYINDYKKDGLIGIDIESYEILDDLSENCGYYEPQKEFRKGEPHLFDDERFKKEIQKAYDKLIKLQNR